LDKGLRVLADNDHVSHMRLRHTVHPTGNSLVCVQHPRVAKRAAMRQDWGCQRESILT
jgi:hypothetical protein